MISNVRVILMFEDDQQDSADGASSINKYVCLHRVLEAQIGGNRDTWVN